MTAKGTVVQDVRNVLTESNPSRVSVGTHS